MPPAAGGTRQRPEEMENMPAIKELSLRAFERFLDNYGIRSRIRYQGGRFYVLMVGHKPGGSRVVLLSNPDLVVACEAAKCAYEQELAQCSAS